MKRMLAVILLCGLLIMDWGCQNAAVKTDSASAQKEAAVDSQSATEQTETSVSSDVEKQEQSGHQTEDRVAAEAETPVLHIDEEKETVSIYTVIETLENCYKTKNYDLWLSLLTSAYRDHFDNAETLASEGWDATNIREFFDLLVSARRRGNIGDLEISRVEFVSDYKAYVYVILEGKEFPEPQHTFIRIGESWYKGLSTQEV